MEPDIKPNTEIDTAQDELPPREQISRLMDDVREMVKAEMAYYHSRLDYSRHVVRWSARFAMASAFAFAGAAIALVMGLVMTLTPHVGPLAATLIVTIAFATIGTFAGLKARKWIRKIYFPEIDGSRDGTE